MRNEALVGYLLHQRPYQEKRALYYLFSQQHGVVHGIGKKGAPLFEPLQLFASGKRELKTFSQINLAPIEVAPINLASAEDNLVEDSLIDQGSAAIQTSTNNSAPYHQQISGQQQYAALYLNEILWKLLPTEDPMPTLWQHYQESLIQLKQPLTADGLRLCLRQFEYYLFKELGFALSLTQDHESKAIEPNIAYRFSPEVGFIPSAQDDGNIQSSTTGSNTTTITALQTLFSGSELLKMVDLGITEHTLSSWSRLHRHLIDHLLDYQPLQSRLLWQQQQRYQ